MTERRPSFDELVGDDLTPTERERLLHVHDLLIEAGPPPEPPAEAPIPLRPRGRRGALIAIAAALALTVFAVSVVVRDRSGGQKADFAVAMSGTVAATGASASLTVFEIDEAGNWPMKFAV